MAIEVASCCCAFHKVVLSAAARQALALAGACGGGMVVVARHVIARFVVGGVAGALARAATGTHFQHDKLLLRKLLSLREDELGLAACSLRASVIATYDHILGREKTYGAAWLEPL